MIRNGEVNEGQESCLSVSAYAIIFGMGRKKPVPPETVFKRNL